MFVIVHIGNGKTVTREIAPPVDLTLHTPRREQRYSGVAKFLSRRSALEERDARETAHTGYRPGKLHQLGADQCRFAAGHDGVMCGAKTHRGPASSSYCQHHYSIVYTGRHYWK